MPVKKKASKKLSRRLSRKAVVVDGIPLSDMTKEQLEEHVIRLREEREREERNYFQAEQDKISSFREINRTELDKKAAHVVLLQQEIGQMQEQHHKEIAVYKQKTKHLEYEHQKKSTEQRLDAQVQLKSRDRQTIETEQEHNMAIINTTKDQLETLSSREEQLERLHHQRVMAKEKLLKAQKKMKHNYVAGRKANTFKINDEVLYSRGQRKDTIFPLYEGPFKITKGLGDNIFVLHADDTDTGELYSRTAHSKQLRPWRNRKPNNGSTNTLTDGHPYPGTMTSNTNCETKSGHVIRLPIKFSDFEMDV